MEQDIDTKTVVAVMAKTIEVIERDIREIKEGIKAISKTLEEKYVTKEELNLWTKDISETKQFLNDLLKKAFWLVVTVVLIIIGGIIGVEKF